MTDPTLPYAVEDSPGPTCHASGCAHTEGTLRCGLAHGHVGPHDLSRQLTVNSTDALVDRLRSRVRALEVGQDEHTDELARHAAKLRNLERHANSGGLVCPDCGCGAPGIPGHAAIHILRERLRKAEEQSAALKIARCGECGCDAACRAKGRG